MGYSDIESQISLIVGDVKEREIIKGILTEHPWVWITVREMIMYGMDAETIKETINMLHERDVEIDKAWDFIKVMWYSPRMTILNVRRRK